MALLDDVRRIRIAQESALVELQHLAADMADHGAVLRSMDASLRKLVELLSPDVTGIVVEPGEPKPR